MENFLFLMNSITDLWKIPSSMPIIVDMSFAIMCGVGLFYLLIPFLKEYPGSPPSRIKKDIPKVVDKGQSKATKKTTIVKVCRNSPKNAQDTQNASRTMERPTQYPLLDSSPKPFCYSKEKLNELSLPQTLSYLKVLEVLIQQKFNQILWGISSVLSESVVATAWVSRKTLGRRKTVRFSEASKSIQALSLAEEHPQLFQDQSLPHPLLTPNLVGITGIQERENLQSSMLNQTPSSLECRTCRRTCRDTEIGLQVSTPNGNEPWQHRLNWKDIAGCNIKNYQAAISLPTDNLTRGTLPTKAIRSTSILSEHCQMLHHHEEPQNEEKAIKVGEQQGSQVGFLPSSELPQLLGDFQPNSDGYCKNLPDLNQPPQPSTLNSKRDKYSGMMGSTLSGMLLKKAIAKYGIPNTIKKDLSFRVKDLSCTSSSTSEKCLEPRHPMLRTDEQLFINTTNDLSFLDPKTKMNLESNIMQHFVKSRRRLPCVSKAEYYSKAATILEKLHHHDPGGTRVETLSSASLENLQFKHLPPEVQETQRAPSRAAASHGPSRSHSDQQLRHQAKPQHSRTIRGSGRGSLQSNTSLGMTEHAWKQSEDVTSGYPHLSAIIVGPEDSAPLSVLKQTNTLRTKEEPPHAWTVSLGSGEIPNVQAINITLKDIGHVGAKRNSGQLQTYTPENSNDLALKINVCTNIDLKLSEQPQSWPVSHHPDGPNIVHAATVSLPSQHSLPNFQNGWQNPKTPQGLGDLLMSSDQSVETWKFRVHKDKIEANNDNAFKPPEERPSILKYGDTSQVERLGRVMPSILSCSQFKYTGKTESQSSLNIAGKRKVPSKRSLMNISSNVAQYANISTEYKGQGDSLRNESTLEVTEQSQEAEVRENLIYSTAVEVQALLNVLLQNLVINEDDPSKVDRDPVTQKQEYKVESLTFQPGGSSHYSEGLCDPNYNRPVRRMTGSHASPEKHNYPCTCSEILFKAQSGNAFQRVCDQDPNKAMGRVGFYQLPTPTGHNHLYCYRGVGDNQPGLADQRAGDSDQIGIRRSQRGSFKVHTHSFRHTGIRDKKELGVDHKAFDPHQNSKKAMGQGKLMSPKQNHSVKDRGIGGQEQSSVAAQRASDPNKIRTKSRKQCSPHRSPKMDKHPLTYRETRNKSQPSVNAPRAHDQHPNSLKRRVPFDSTLTPKGNNHLHLDRVTGDKQQLNLADKRTCDLDQSTRNRMGYYSHRSSKWNKLALRYREIGEKALSYVNSQRICDQCPNSVKRRRGFDHLPTPKENKHQHSCRVIGDKQQSSIADQRVYDPGEINKKSRMAGCQPRYPEGNNFLVRFGLIENNQLPNIILSVCDTHQSTKEGMDCAQPNGPKESHPVKDRTGGLDQSGLLPREPLASGRPFQQRPKSMYLRLSRR